MSLEELELEIKDTNLILVGLGEELKGDLAVFYKRLNQLLNGKDYFILTLGERKGLEDNGLLKERISAPFSEGENKQSWRKFLEWLSLTLNHKLCVLEFGAGFFRPDIIRFPFERVSYFNKKAKLVRINETFSQLPAELANRGISIQRNPVDFLLD